MSKVKLPKKLPKEILAYPCDVEENRDPVMVVALRLDDVPPDHHGEKVGTYVLKRTSTFVVKRKLK